MSPQWIMLGVNLLVIVCGFVGGVWTLSWTISKRMSQIDSRIDGVIASVKGDYEAQLKLLEKETSSKIGRVYQRFDEHKSFLEDKMENRYVCKDMCNVMHNTTTNEIKGLREDMKALGEKIDRIIEKG